MTTSHFRKPFKFADEYENGEIPFNYSFSNPKSYFGPVVKGWPPSRSRDANIYIRPYENTILTGNNLNVGNCGDNEKL